MDEGLSADAGAGAGSGYDRRELEDFRRQLRALQQELADARGKGPSGRAAELQRAIQHIERILAQGA